jgi:hypothetical protein
MIVWKPRIFLDSNLGFSACLQIRERDVSVHTGSIRHISIPDTMIPQMKIANCKEVIVATNPKVVTWYELV